MTEEVFESLDVQPALTNEVFADLIYNDIMAAASFRCEKPESLIVQDGGAPNGPNWAKIGVIAGIVAGVAGLGALLLRRSRA